MLSQRFQLTENTTYPWTDKGVEIFSREHELALPNVGGSGAKLWYLRKSCGSI